MIISITAHIRTPTQIDSNYDVIISIRQTEADLESLLRDADCRLHFQRLI